MSAAVCKRRNQPTAGGNQLGLPGETGKLLRTKGSQEFPEEWKLEESQCSVFIFRNKSVRTHKLGRIEAKRSSSGHLIVCLH